MKKISTVRALEGSEGEGGAGLLQRKRYKRYMTRNTMSQGLQFEKSECTTAHAGNRKVLSQSRGEDAALGRLDGLGPLTRTPRQHFPPVPTSVGSARPAPQISDAHAVWTTVNGSSTRPLTSAQCPESRQTLRESVLVDEPTPSATTLRLAWLSGILARTLQLAPSRFSASLRSPATRAQESARRRFSHRCWWDSGDRSALLNDNHSPADE